MKRVEVEKRNRCGRAIRLLRATRGLSKQELAAQAGISASYLTLIEQDKRAPSARVVAGIVGALGVPASLWRILRRGTDASVLRRITRGEAEVVGRWFLGDAWATYRERPRRTMGSRRA